MKRVALLALLLAGCTESIESDAGTTATPDAGTTEVTCEGIFVSDVRGRVVDESGAPVEGARAQLCARLSPTDALVCLRPEASDASGTFQIQPEGDTQCLRTAAMRVLVPGTTETTTYCELPLDGSTMEGRLDAPADYVLYGTEPATTLPERGDASAARTVVFADGTTVEVVPEQMFPSDAYESLGSRRLPADAPRPCFDDGSFLAVYAFDPEVTLAAAGAVTFPAPEGVAAGDEVDILILGGLDTRFRDGEVIEEAEIESLGVGTVSADGTTIETDVELPALNWLMLRRR